MVTIIDEHSASFLRDVGGLISGFFNLLEFLLGVSFFCGQKLTEWMIIGGGVVSEILRQFSEILFSIGLELWDFAGGVVRGLLLIYYGIWMIFEGSGINSSCALLS